MKTETLIHRLTRGQPRHYGGGTVLLDDTELARFAGMLGSVAEQLPYATARALTATAFAARDALVKQVPKSFHERTDWTRRGFHVDQARKADTPQQATVGSFRAYMAVQAEGGTRPAKDPQGTVAVPIAARRVLSDILTPRTWPRALLKTVRLPRTTLRVQKNDAYFAGVVGGMPGLWLRTSRVMAPLPIYRFMKAADIHIRPRFPFGSVVEAAARTAFPPLFEHWLFAALEGRR